MNYCSKDTAGCYAVDKVLTSKVFFRNKAGTPSQPTLTQYTVYHPLSIHPPSPRLNTLPIHSTHTINTLTRQPSREPIRGLRAQVPHRGRLLRGQEAHDPPEPRHKAVGAAGRKDEGAVAFALRCTLRRLASITDSSGETTPTALLTARNPYNPCIKKSCPIYEPSCISPQKVQTLAPQTTLTP